jgi:DNA-binding CsgD family transcriptional regulator
MTQVATNRQFPGMGDSAIEFFISDKETKFIQHGKVLPFSEIPFATIKLLDEAIHADININLELHDMHPISKLKRIEQFARCRFGGLDFVGDIINGKLQEGEYHECPKRGNCKSEGILCKLPDYNGEKLSSLEIKLMQQLSTSKTIEAIIYEMDLRPGTFHKIHNILYSKLGVQTRQEVTKIAYLLNLIQL